MINRLHWSSKQATPSTVALHATFFQLLKRTTKNSLSSTYDEKESPNSIQQDRVGAESEWHTLHMYTNCSCSCAHMETERQRERERTPTWFADRTEQQQAAQLEICNMIADRHSQASGNQTTDNQQPTSDYRQQQFHGWQKGAGLQGAGEGGQRI